MATSTATQAARRRILQNPRNRIRIAMQLRAASANGEFPSLGFGEYFQLADACVAVAKKASADELDQFGADCCDNGNGDGVRVFEAKLATELGASPLIDLIIQLLPVLLPLLIGCL